MAIMVWWGHLKNGRITNPHSTQILKLHRGKERPWFYYWNSRIHCHCIRWHYCCHSHCLPWLLRWQPSRSLLWSGQGGWGDCIVIVISVPSVLAFSCSSLSPIVFIHSHPPHPLAPGVCWLMCWVKDQVVELASTHCLWSLSSSLSWSPPGCCQSSCNWSSSLVTINTVSPSVHFRRLLIVVSSLEPIVCRRLGPRIVIVVIAANDNPVNIENGVKLLSLWAPLPPP